MHRTVVVTERLELCLRSADRIWIDQGAIIAHFQDLLFLRSRQRLISHRSNYGAQLGKKVAVGSFRTRAPHDFHQ